ncbi:MAG: hypothetical protein R2911_25030 [Caldilineaceae bacterium]
MTARRGPSAAAQGQPGGILARALANALGVAVEAGDASAIPANWVSAPWPTICGGGQRRIGAGG